jgi:hypothetical protein
VSFHINKATPDFDAGRSDQTAVSFDVSRPAGAKSDLIVRQYIKKLAEATRDVPASNSKDISTDRSVLYLFSRTTLVLLELFIYRNLFPWRSSTLHILFIPLFCYCGLRRKGRTIL